MHCINSHKKEVYEAIMQGLHTLYPCRAARIFLRVALSLITLASIAILLSYLDARKLDRVLADHYYSALLEYPIAALSITAGGLYLIEAVDREHRKDET